VIISPGTDKSTILLLAQRLLDAINVYNFGNEKHIVKLKLSMAIASYPEDRVARGMDLIELTDQILNKVKEYGGNKVYSYIDIRKESESILKRNNQKQNVDIKFLKNKIGKLTKRANQSLVEAILAFAKTIELKDHYTGEHVEKTVHYAREVAAALKLSPEEIDRIGQASILHDLGKIGISEKILLKKSRLTKKEFEEIKKHPQIGVDIIRPIQFLHGLIPFLLYHHERWDGKGYPHGLKGEEIPIGARIVAIADVYQSLTSQRPYRKAYSKNEAIKIIKKGAGTQFDPKIVNGFLSIIQKEN
jgi:HD-GYP domain-containing protein (c-di-GMP phosphodiesterase class II)